MDEYSYLVVSKRKKEYDATLEFDRERKVYHISITYDRGFWKGGVVQVDQKRFIPFDDPPGPHIKEMIERYERPEQYIEEIEERNGVIFLEGDDEDEEEKEEPANKPRGKILYTHWLGEKKYI